MCNPPGRLDTPPVSRSLCFHCIIEPFLSGWESKLPGPEGFFTEYPSPGDLPKNAVFDAKNLNSRGLMSGEVELYDLGPVKPYTGGGVGPAPQLLILALVAPDVAPLTADRTLLGSLSVHVKCHAPFACQLCIPPVVSFI